MEFAYCPRCGQKLGEKIIGDEGVVRYCFNCEEPFFDNPASCVDVLVINEHKQILLLKQNYISTTHWTLVSGYVKNGDTLEETVVREVLEETGQQVLKLQYISSYYYKPKQIIMAGFIAFVDARAFADSNEVDDIKWCDITEVNKYIARVDNMSGTHFDNCLLYLEKTGHI